LIYNMLGSYDAAWQWAVGIGILAGIAQMTMNTQPTARVAREQGLVLRPATQARS
jgi:hypothetical protein